VFVKDTSISDVNRSSSVVNNGGGETARNGSAQLDLGLNPQQLQVLVNLFYTKQQQVKRELLLAYLNLSSCHR